MNVREDEEPFSFKENSILVGLSDLLTDSRDNVENIQRILNSFSCREKDLQDFLHNKAIDFEKRNISRTYLYFRSSDMEIGKMEIVAYFAISMGKMDISNFSKTKQRKLSGGQSSTNHVAHYLLGQIAKSTSLSDQKIGHFLIDEAIKKIKEAQKIVAGRFVVVDAINVQKIIDFYKINGFTGFEEEDKMLKKAKSIKMLKLMSYE